MSKDNQRRIVKTATALATFLIYTISTCRGQDIVIKNPDSENKPVYSFIDSTFISEDKMINIDIGPSVKLSQNTIFLNKPFQISRDTIKTLKIKGSFIQHMKINASTFEVFKIDSADFDTLTISNSTMIQPISFKNVNIKHLVLINNNINTSLDFIECNIENFQIKRCFFGEGLFAMKSFFSNIDCLDAIFLPSLDFHMCSFGSNISLHELTVTNRMNFSYTHSTAKGFINISFIQFPDSLVFSDNQDFANVVEIKDEFSFKKPKKKCKLYFSETDVSKFHFKYEPFIVSFTDDFSEDEKERVYTRLLENFKADGSQFSYEKLDIEYKRFKAQHGFLWFFWWMPDVWWKYGYEKERVFYIAACALLLFATINFFAYDMLNRNVYPIPKIPVYTKGIGNRIWFAFIYTAIIFFSLSIKLDKIEWKNKGWSSYVLLIYVFGIICLAYMTNYIIQR